MSDQFYSYLSKKIIGFFKENPLTPGSKYNIQFEKKDEVMELYKELQNNTRRADYEYRDENREVKYKSYMLKFPSADLIVAATINNVQPDFLTRLRNLVGVENKYEKDKAILFIHDTNLDSIMGGTESFSKEGMPFHMDSIQKDIRKELLDSSFSTRDKEIIEFDLERKRRDLLGDNVSIFEYKDLLAIINQTCIEKDEYKKFGLFYDSKLNEFTGKELKRRIAENASNFARIDEIHNYGNPETQLEKYYDDIGVEALKKDDWKEIDYKKIEKFIEDKVNTPILGYIEKNVSGWDRPEGKSKAKSRIRNIIIFNEEQKEDIDTEYLFDGLLHKEDLKFEGNLEAYTSGKRIIVKLHKCNSGINFYKIKYKHLNKTRFEFRIAVICINQAYLESIQTEYSINIKKNSNRIVINTNESHITFNEYASMDRKYDLYDNYDTIEILKEEKVNIRISDDFQYENDSDEVQFKLKIDECIIPLSVIATSEKSAPIEGMKIWKLKREKKCDFKLIGENKLQHGANEYFAREDFRKNLQTEKKILEFDSLCYIETIDGIEGLDDIEVDDNVSKAYQNIIKYFNDNKKLPSLAYLNETLKDLYQEFINAYIRAIKNIEEKSYIKAKEKGLFKIGTIKREIEDRELLFTPLHPLNIAYQLHINKILDNSDIDDDIIKKFNSTYLLPYIDDGSENLYIPMEQTHSPEWKYYVDNRLPRYKSSRDFVSKLVIEKIEEFTNHFDYLFDMGNNAPIKINLINTGDSKEILQGIFKYYVKMLKDKRKDILPIDLFIYSDKNITNAFEEVAFNDNIEDLKETYNLNLNVSNMSEEDVLDLYRQKVHFYAKNIAKGIEYAHITFVEMNNSPKIITTNMNDIPSGIIFNGLISGVPSVFLGDAYRTGFGTKYANTESDLMAVAKGLNSINCASGGDSYSSEACKVISVDNNNKSTLEEIYNSSHWVTFIDPKVDLNFFKNDPGAKDLLIIHYSDQYTTAGGYDAITVTRKSGPYQRVIEDFLTKNDIEDAEKYSSNVINMFNAINGDWLLRLISSKSYFPKEKISILSAIKVALAKFKKDNIIWVPISLEEVLRVSGGAGLKQSEGFLSAKKLGFENSGATSDDILLIGIEEKENEIFVHYYPIEVKIGENPNWYIGKGIEQAKSTKKIFSKILLPKENGKLTNNQKVYRNFLMQLVITSSEKLNLYSFAEGEDWSSIIDSDLRRKLLNEEYIISNSLDDSIGEAAVISFKHGNNSNTLIKQDNVMVIEMSEEDGFKFITKSVEEIKEEIGNIEIVEGTNTIKYSEQPTEELIENPTIDDSDNIDFEKINDSEEKKLNSEDYQEDNVDSVNNKVAESINISDKENEIDESKFVEHNNSITKEEFNKEEIRILLGKSKGKSVYWEFGNKGLGNRHLLISGKSGQGKTYFIQCLLLELAKQGIPAIIFDYTDGFKASKLEPEFKDMLGDNLKQLLVAKDKFPINPFKKNQKELDEDFYIDEESSDIADRIKSVLGSVYKLGPQQLNTIYKSVMSGVNKYGEKMNLQVLREELEEEGSSYAKTAIGQLNLLIDKNPFDNTKEFDWNDILNDKGKVFIIQLTGFNRDVQLIITELILWDLWHFTVQHGDKDKPFAVILDEAQNLNFGDNSPYTRILTEGRKFGWSGWFATQFLKGQMNTSAINRLQNAAHKIYFAPPDEEISSIANALSINNDEKKHFERELMRLQKGECISYGPSKESSNKLINCVYKVKVSSLEERK